MCIRDSFNVCRALCGAYGLVVIGALQKFPEDGDDDGIMTIRSLKTSRTLKYTQLFCSACWLAAWLSDIGRRSLTGGLSLIAYVPDLWLTCDHFVGKASAMGQSTRPTQPSIPSGSVNE